MFLSTNRNRTILKGQGIFKNVHQYIKDITMHCDLLFFGYLGTHFITYKKYAMNKSILNNVNR